MQITLLLTQRTAHARRLVYSRCDVSALFGKQLMHDYAHLFFPLYAARMQHIKSNVMSMYCRCIYINHFCALMLFVAIVSNFNEQRHGIAFKIRNKNSNV